MNRLMDFLYGFLSFLGPVAGSLVVGLAATPSVLLVRWGIRQASAISNEWLAALVIALAIGFGYYLFGMCAMTLVVVLRFVLGLRNREGAAYFYQPAAFRSAINNYLIHIVHFLFLPLVRGTPVLIWFYRGLGAKIGRGVFIMSTRIWDLDMIEIGDNSVIGGNVGMSAHAVEGSKGTMRPIKIGKNVNIGADTLILPGVRIGDNVIVGANSLVPKEAVLEPDSVYGGVPVHKIR